MTTLQVIANQAVGGKHLGPGGMAGVFKQQPAVEPGSIIGKAPTHNSCGARVTLQAHTTASAVIMAAGECGLSGVVCADCAALTELMSAPADEPGLHMRG